MRSRHPAVPAAHEPDPALAVLRTDCSATTREVLEVVITGLPGPPLPSAGA